MKINIFSALLFSMAYTTLTPDAFASSFPGDGQPLSKYGQIQNVQNYSSNPFWNPNSPYNQRMPQPVYVQGADLNTGDCQRTVSALIASECALKNNCASVSLSDIRPTIMLQLSRLPGHNYATACAGYIDSEFNNYVKNYGHAGAGTRNTGFPAATMPSNLDKKSDYKIPNPLAPQLPTWNGEPWMQEMLERELELKNLQSQNGAGNEKIVRMDFPKTAADLSFSEQMENKRTGYEPYKDSSAYVVPEIEKSNEYTQRQNEYMLRKSAFCSQELARLKILNADLAKLQKCQSDGKKFADCKTQGSY